jgi:hypothetical protein
LPFNGPEVVVEAGPFGPGGDGLPETGSALANFLLSITMVRFLPPNSAACAKAVFFNIFNIGLGKSFLLVSLYTV